MLHLFSFYIFKSRKAHTHIHLYLVFEDILCKLIMTRTIIKIWLLSETFSLITTLWFSFLSLAYLLTGHKYWLTSMILWFLRKKVILRKVLCRKLLYEKKRLNWYFLPVPFWQHNGHAIQTRFYYVSYKIAKKFNWNF